jgi:hypothetical protein
MSVRPSLLTSPTPMPCEYFSVPGAPEAETGISARALVVGHRHDIVPGPKLAFFLGVLVPPGCPARMVLHDEIRVAVAIDVIGEIAERIAIRFGIVGLWLFHDGDHVPVGSCVVDRASRNVELAVVIEIADGTALAAKLIVEHGFFERDFTPCRAHRTDRKSERQHHERNASARRRREGANVSTTNHWKPRADKPRRTWKG